MPVYPKNCDDCEFMKDSIEYNKVKQIFKKLNIVFKEDTLCVVNEGLNMELVLEDLLLDFWEDYADILEAENESEEMFPFK